MSEKPIREYDRLIIRLPDGMRERIAESASRNDRSMNAEVVAILDDTLGHIAGSLLSEAEREKRVVEQQLEAHQAALDELNRRYAVVSDKVATLRQQTVEPDSSGRTFTVRPRPRPKGQFVPTRRDEAAPKSDIPDNLKPRR